MPARQEFRYSIGETIDNGLFHGTIMSAYRKNGGKYYSYICSKCGYEGDKIESSIDIGSGCPCCYNKVVKVGFNDAGTTAPWMIPFFQGGIEEARRYTSQSHEKIFPVCPFCGRVSDKSYKINTIYQNHGFGCVCKDTISIPNKTIYSVAKQLLSFGEIKEFHREYVFPDTNNPFDVMMVDNEDRIILVEMDGGLHSYIMRKHGRIAVPAKSLLMDEIKDSIAKEHNCILIRVDCYESDFDYIKNNLINSGLSDIVSLDGIKWEEVKEFVYGNLVKTVCEYRNNHPNSSTSEIGIVFDLSANTISNYLKKGMDIGWCVYDAKEEWRRVHTDMLRPNADIYTKVIDNNGEEHYFRTISQLGKCSEEIFGTYIYPKKLSKLLKGNNNQIDNLFGCKIYRISKEEYLKWHS